MIVKLAMLESLKNAMNAIGVTGMTVTQVMGMGLQKGAGEKYRLFSGRQLLHLAVCVVGVLLYITLHELTHGGVEGETDGGRWFVLAKDMFTMVLLAGLAL